MLKWKMRTSASEIVIFFEFEAIYLYYFTLISKNSLNFPRMSLGFFLKFPFKLTFLTFFFEFLKKFFEASKNP